MAINNRLEAQWTPIVKDFILFFYAVNLRLRFIVFYSSKDQEKLSKVRAYQHRVGYMLLEIEEQNVFWLHWTQR